MVFERQAENLAEQLQVIDSSIQVRWDVHGQITGVSLSFKEFPAVSWHLTGLVGLT